MAFTDSITYNLAGGQTDSLKVDGTGEGRLSIAVDVTTGQTDKEVVGTLDVSQVKLFYARSSQNVTLETNDGSSPGNTINLVANIPYVYVSTGYDTFKLTVDVTKFLVTNASGSTASIIIEAVYDSTP